MKSVILTTITQFVHPLLLMFSVFLLLRGHNEPGGGFAGGLVAASAFALYAMAHDARTAQKALRASPHWLMGIGLLLALSSGLISILFGDPFLTGAWIDIPVPGLGEWSLGTPLLFDVGVYLVVVGMTMLIVLSLVEA